MAWSQGRIATGREGTRGADQAATIGWVLGLSAAVVLVTATTVPWLDTIEVALPDAPYAPPPLLIGLETGCGRAVALAGVLIGFASLTGLLGARRQPTGRRARLQGLAPVGGLVGLGVAGTAYAAIVSRFVDDLEVGPGIDLVPVGLLLALVGVVLAGRRLPRRGALAVTFLALTTAAVVVAAYFAPRSGVPLCPPTDFCRDVSY